MNIEYSMLRRKRMFGSYIGIPALRTYAQALEHHESIKPIRGKEWLRPIINSPNGRRRKHMQILKQRDGSVACRLYDTDVLTYYPNGEIHFTNGGYATNSTHQFATALLNRWDRYGCYFSSHKGQTAATVRNKTVVIENGEVLKLRYDKDMGFDFIDPPKMHAYYLKRAPMGMRRKEIEPFTKYVLALAKLVDPEQYDQGRYRLTAEELYQMVLNNEEWHDAADFLLRRCCTMRVKEWHLTLRNLGTPKPQPMFSILPKDITNMLDDMLKYMYAEDLFERREVDKPNTNDNETYMTGAGTYL
jgi:hypothetical protein